MSPAIRSREIRKALAKPELWLPLLLLLAAFCAGGSSANQPLRDMIVELFGAIVLAAAAAGLIGSPFSRDARVPLFLIAALAALMLFQLVPLPHPVWSELGGRSLSATIFDLIGARGEASPLSLQPERTVLSALALLPGVAMAVAVMRLGISSRAVLAFMVVALALVSLILGILQATLGDPQALTLYKTSHLGLPLGVFANTNHQADLLVIGFVIAGTLSPSLAAPGGGWAAKPYWVYGFMAALAVGIVATGSRTGIALLGIGLAAVVLRERVTGNVRLFLLGALVLAVGLVLLVLFNPVFARSFADFSNLDDPRFHFWPNVTWAIGQFGWLGTGAGTFEDVYRSAETLETLSPRFLNHAHNDYLEIMLEMGIPGMILLAGFFAFVVSRTIAIIRRSEGLAQALGYAALVCMGILLLHSAVDYPLRTPLLSTIFGLLVGLITTSVGENRPAGRIAPNRTSRALGTVGG